MSFELVPACRQLDTIAQQPVHVKVGAIVPMHGHMEAGSHGVRTGKKTVVRAGMMYLPASMTSFLGARTVPPATGYILSASCTHRRITERYATTHMSAEGSCNCHDAVCSEGAHSITRTAAHSNVAE